ncbi:CRR6 family NdhI maturation factor [Myxosarcina sp. GI1]|uniref:CRR6 family NdhI maturation factor n=1 Tax=Myxosarcina sp. GI1 TaxID=1541065 RepID=UPI00055C4F3B|nr:CRR6 family NdhI maturation factor [Myxosarcina sp. GI1]
MTFNIALDNQKIDRLDLTDVHNTIVPLLENNRIASYEQQLRLKIDYQRDATDPRELSEIPTIRLWHVRLDAAYPWLPFLLDWKAGELARYGAMLVPHQFNRSEGIIFNPEALEIFVMNKIFVLSDWLRQQEITPQLRLKSLAQSFGYDIDDAFFEMIY